MRKTMIPGHWDDILDAVQTRSLRDDITWVQFTAVCVESDVEVSFLKLVRNVMKEHAISVVPVID
jgi:hypothetical protein